MWWYLGGDRSWFARRKPPSPQISGRDVAKRSGADPCHPGRGHEVQRGQNRMLSQKEKNEIRRVLEDEQRRLSRTSQNALSYSMIHERNYGRDSIAETM